MLRILNSWRTRESTGASRRLHLHFYHAPVEVLGADRVEGVRFERTEPTGDGGVRGTGEYREIAVQQVYRAVGYYGTPVVDAPFDDTRGVIPNVEGRVHDGGRARSPGCTRPAGSSADRSASSATPSPTPWRRSRTSSPTREAGVLRAAGRRTATCSTCSTSARSRTRRGTAGSPSTRTSASSAQNHRHTRERVKVVPRDEQVGISRRARSIGS